MYLSNVFIWSDSSKNLSDETSVMCVFLVVIWTLFSLKNVPTILSVTLINKIQLHVVY
jgi:hypothetical protein